MTVVPQFAAMVDEKLRLFLEYKRKRFEERCKKLGGVPDPKRFTCKIGENVEYIEEVYLRPPRVRDVVYVYKEVPKNVDIDNRDVLEIEKRTNNKCTILYEDIENKTYIMCYSEMLPKLGEAARVEQIKEEIKQLERLAAEAEKLLKR